MVGNHEHKLFHYLGTTELSSSIITSIASRGQPEFFSNRGNQHTTPSTSLSDAEAANQNNSVKQDNSSNGDERSVEERIIDHLDYVQLCGELVRRSARETRQVTVDVSRNGVNFIDHKEQRVIERLAMHKIIQCLSYENEIGSSNVVLVMSRTDSNAVCHVLQSEDHNEADQLCQHISESFQSIAAEANERSQEDRKKQRNEFEQKRHVRKRQQRSPDAQ